jgi:hypothetical protein
MRIFIIRLSLQLLSPRRCSSLAQMPMRLCADEVFGVPVVLGPMELLWLGGVRSLWPPYVGGCG